MDKDKLELLTRDEIEALDMEEVLEMYLDDKGDLMPSFTNFRKWARQFKISFSQPQLAKVRITLDMLHIDWLQEAAAKGGRYSQMYSHLLKIQLEQMKESKSQEVPITITVDFQNESKNKI